MKSFLILSVLSLVCLCGCRREDVREYTVEVRNLSEVNVPAIKKAFSRYHGIRDVHFNPQEAKIDVVYDSMEIAQKNIREAIRTAQVGLVVPEPQPKNGRAGH